MTLVNHVLIAAFSTSADVAGKCVGRGIHGVYD
jgi:hypothetical protein